MRCSAQRGFTVIELMIALAIAAMMLTLVYQSALSVTTAREQLAVDGARYRAARVITDRLGRELRSLQFRGVDASLAFTATGSTEQAEIAFTSLASTPLARLPGMPARISYRLRPATADESGPYVLERLEKGSLQLGESRHIRMLQGITSLSFRFYADGTWRSGWNSLELNRLPDIVSMELAIGESPATTFRTAWDIQATGG